MREFPEIIQDMKDGKEQGFADFYERTHTKAMYVAMSYMKNKPDAEDVLQESYIRATLKLDTIRDPRCAQAWFDTIVSRKALEKIKQKTHQRTVKKGEGNKETVKIHEDSYDAILDKNGDEIELSGNSMEFNPESIVDKKHTASVIAGALNQLNPDQEFIITAKYYSQLTIAEIAEIMGCSEGTVKSRMNRGLNALKDKKDYFEKNGIRVTSFGMLIALLSWHFKSESYAYSDTIIELLNKGALSPDGTWMAIEESINNTGEVVKTTENISKNTSLNTTNAGKESAKPSQNMPNNTPKSTSYNTGYTAQNIAKNSVKAVRNISSLRKFFTIGAVLIPTATAGIIAAKTLKNIHTSIENTEVYETAVEAKNMAFSNEELVKYSGSEYLFIPVSCSQIEDGYEVELQVFKELRVPAESLEDLDYSYDSDHDKYINEENWYVEADGISYCIAAPPYSCIPKLRTVTKIIKDYEFPPREEYYYNGTRDREDWSEKSTYNPETDYLLWGIPGAPVTSFSLRYVSGNPDYYVVMNDMNFNPSSLESEYGNGLNRDVFYKSEERTENRSMRLVDTIKNIKIRTDIFNDSYLPSSSDITDLDPLVDFNQIYAYSMVIDEYGIVDSISKTSNTYNNIILSDESHDAMGNPNGITLIKE